VPVSHCTLASQIWREYVGVCLVYTCLSVSVLVSVSGSEFVSESVSESVCVCDRRALLWVMQCRLLGRPFQSMWWHRCVCVSDICMCVSHRYVFGCVCDRRRLFRACHGSGACVCVCGRYFYVCVSQVCMWVRVSQKWTFPGMSWHRCMCVCLRQICVCVHHLYVCGCVAELAFNKYVVARVHVCVFAADGSVFVCQVCMCVRV